MRIATNPDPDPDPLNWSTEPDGSRLLDGKIEVRGTNYYVHQAILAQQSFFFDTLFCHSEGTTILTLEDEEQATVFPVVLDFVYSKDKNNFQNVCAGLMTEESVALYKLADFLLIDKICSTLKEHWKTSMEARDCGEYLELATIFSGDVTLMDIIAQKFLDNIATLATDPRIRKVWNAVFVRAVKKKSESGTQNSYRVDLFVDRFLYQKEHVEDDPLLQLANIAPLRPRVVAGMKHHVSRKLKRIGILVVSLFGMLLLSGELTVTETIAIAFGSFLTLLLLWDIAFLLFDSFFY